MNENNNSNTPNSPKKKNVWLIAGISAFCLVFLALVILFFYQLNHLAGSVRNEIQAEREASDGSAQNVAKLFEDKGQDIDLSLVSSDVTILPSKDGEIHLNYQDRSNVWFELEETDGKIRLIEKHKNFSIDTLDGEPAHFSLNFQFSNIGDLFSGTISDSNIELRLPEGGDRQITIDTVSGSCDASALSTSGNFGFSTVSGDLEANRCTLGKLDLDSTSGEVDLNAVSFESLSFSTVSGDLDGNLLGSPGDYKVKFSSVSGKNNLAHCNGDKKIIEFDSVSGDLDLDFDFDD